MANEPTTPTTELSASPAAAPAAKLHPMQLRAMMQAAAAGK